MKKSDNFVTVAFRNVSMIGRFFFKKNFRACRIDLLDRTAFILSELKVKLASFLQ